MQAKLAEISAAAYGSGTLKEVAELIWGGRCGCNGLHFLYVDVVALKFTIQSSAADPKQSSRQHLVPFCLFEDATDCLSFHVLQIIGGRSAFRPRTGFRRNGTNGWRQILYIDGSTIAQCNRPFDAVFQLANIARPVILQ